MDEVIKNIKDNWLIILIVVVGAWYLLGGSAGSFSSITGKIKMPSASSFTGGSKGGLSLSGRTVSPSPGRGWVDLARRCGMRGNFVNAARVAAANGKTLAHRVYLGRSYRCP